MQTFRVQHLEGDPLCSTLPHKLHFAFVAGKPNKSPGPVLLFLLTERI